MGAINNAVIDLAARAITPVVVGVVTPYVVDSVKKVSTWLDGAPAYVKQGAAVVTASAATMLATVVEVGVPTDLAQWDATAVKTILAALLGIAIKQHKQLKKLKG